MMIAHIKQDAQGTWHIHSLEEHMRGVAEFAERFAGDFSMGTMAYVAGALHDLGKASAQFQGYIKGNSGYIKEKDGVVISQKIDHSSAGAQFITDKFEKEIRTILGYALAGHHGGLPDGKNEKESCLSRRLKKSVPPHEDGIGIITQLLKGIDTSELKKCFQKHIHAAADRLSPSEIQSSSFFRKFYYQFLVRMLFSCLVDADYLDTQRFMDPGTFSKRAHGLDITQLRRVFNAHVARFRKGPVSAINEKRNAILTACEERAEEAPGFYSLTVPTGGGKTLSSMAFALRHAEKYGKKRILYLIPYTSIITQNARVFRDIFGEEAVLEHHSNLDPARESYLNQLASENWDTPIIVTTNVQFFESLFANRTSTCRKVHNITNSVLLFDEAQMLPPEYLKPCMAVLRQLVYFYNCTVVFCTATQPAFTDTNILSEPVREIIPDPPGLYESFRRVTVSRIGGRLSSEELAHHLAKHRQVLAIVNTRREARIAYERLGALQREHVCIHLSTMMCPAHRDESLTMVKKVLEENKPCCVVSTQLIEAGVDIDFPVVFRQETGIDSIAQAAGRCNRNATLSTGQVYVFAGEKSPPPGHLRKGADAAREIIDRYPDDLLNLQAVREYFVKYYNTEKMSAEQMNKNDILGLCSREVHAIPYTEIASRFRMIADEKISVIVPYNDHARSCIDRLSYFRDAIVPRELQRRIQRYCVQVYTHIAEKLVSSGAVEDVFGDGKYYVLINRDLYNDKTGLNPEVPEFMQTESAIL